MPEAIAEQFERQPEAINRVLQRMMELHAISAQEKSDAERISEGMSSQIMGETTQRAHQALVEQETQKLRETALQEGWDGQRLAQEIAVMQQRVTADMFKEHWFESTLSTPDHPIHAATYGTSMFRYDLRTLMAENPSPERLQEFGWIMFDVDGLRSFKDCTSHEHTTRFLQEIVRVIVNQNGPTNQMLREAGVRVIPMATGGDEFVLYLRGRSPLSSAFINQVTQSFQQEISSNERLRAMLNFGDERVLVKYGMPSRKQREEFAKLSPEERRQKLAAIRASLPEQFVPSVAGGGALLEEGILHAVEKDDHDLQGSDETFSSVREKIVQSTLDLAEERQKKNKERDLAQLETTKPRQHAFRLRNGENRRLQSEKRRLEQELEATRGQLQELFRPKTDKMAS